MTQWSLPDLLAGLHAEVTDQLARARKTLGHSGTKGDGSENIWLTMLREYLPKRYQAEKAHIVDCLGNFSEQIDIVIFDRQYSPFIFKIGGQSVIPAESVYAVFEAKQITKIKKIADARRKAASVRKLHRTSIAIPTANGPAPAKEPFKILAGIVTLESDWKPPLGVPLRNALTKDITDAEHLDMGCIAQHGHFEFDAEAAAYNFHTTERAATAFLFELIARLQVLGTVPMIDIRAYAKWLTQPEISLDWKTDDPI
ncbi:hypothetical protein MACH10_00240 [Thalassospira tepidiphila]|uniref:DUF6602 domain-containing protein n=1 Tax=Thalassospira tepidiphila TaxID=393657 RepID=UPI002922BA52|nr:hypothetical protein MACH10_00240 [Thalassospira tepidiphila]